MKTAAIISMALALFLCISNEAGAQSLTEYAKKRKAEIAEMQRIERERYEAAVSNGTLAVFQEFLKQYPEGKYSQDVKNRIADYSLWEEAKRTNTIQAYKQYLLTSQFKTFSTEANAAIEDLQSIDEWQRLKSSKSLIELEAFIKKYPKSSVLAEVKRRVHELKGVQYYNDDELLKAYDEFNAVGGRDFIDSSNRSAYDKSVEYHEFCLLNADSKQESLMSFLRKYPNSEYASQVSNWIALSKAKDFTIFSTKTSYNIAISYARDEATRVKVKDIYDAKQREFARYKKQQRVANRRANGGVGLEVYGHNVGEQETIEINPELTRVVQKYSWLGDFHEGLARVRKRNYRTVLWGFIDKNGKMVIPCRYDDAGDFSEGLAAVRKGGLWGFIDKNGKEVIPCRYNDVEVFSEGLARVRKGLWWGFINKSGEEIIPCRYDDAGDFSEGLAAVKNGDLWGFVNKNGEKVIPCIYYSIQPFSEGLARVRKGLWWGFINTNGEEVVPCMYYAAGDFSEGLAAVKKGGLWGFINRNGEQVIPCRYNEAEVFSEDLAAVRKGGLWGFINKNGEEVIPCRYYYVGDFSEGLAPVLKYGPGWGFINKIGEEVIPCRYNDVSSFSEGLAAVRFYGKSGYVDKNGNSTFVGR